MLQPGDCAVFLNSRVVSTPGLHQRTRSAGAERASGELEPDRGQNEMAGLVLRCETDELVGPPPPTGLNHKVLAMLAGDAWPAQRCPVQTGEQVVEREVK